MQITLQIENFDRLETGGQVSYTCSDRGFDIGRHEHLDWSLPDPQRVISGKHCEIRFEGNGFVLHDMSTNGTFMNGSPNRMDKPHMLRSGDRFMVGDYIISVAIEGGVVPSHPVHPNAASVPSQPPIPSFPVAPQQPFPQRDTWPAPPSSADPSYPMPQPSSPWGAPETGMEGRHAPPSDAPGVGTPADDVWSQQGHGWGNSDPALYSPQADTPVQQPPRPAQADPLDHLASQPDLQPRKLPENPALAGGMEAAPSQPGLQSPVFSEAEGAPAPSEPLFGMPDLGSTEPAPVQERVLSSELPEAVDAKRGLSEKSLSPFPEASPPETGASSSASSEMKPKADQSSVSQPPPSEFPEVVEDRTPIEESQSPRLDPIVEPPKEDASEAGDSFLRAFAEGAGIPVMALDGRDPDELARELGDILAGVTGDLMGLLAARSHVKALTRNANRTMISRTGNNALKFSPTPQVALQTMLSENAEANGYLPIKKAMANAFKDIQKHHVWTYSAMQKAAARFEQTLSPKAIEAEGLVQKSTFGNVKAKQWEKLNERWTSLVSTHDDGLVGVFTQYFTENYEELSRADDGEDPGF